VADFCPGEFDFWAELACLEDWEVFGRSVLRSSDL